MAPKLAIVAQNTLIRFAMGVLAQLLEEYSKIVYWTNLCCPRVQNTKESVRTNKKGKPMNCAVPRPKKFCGAVWCARVVFVLFR